MKIKTYATRDMRSALRLVREEQGPDAVILSTRHLPDGGEVTVAVDPDADLLAAIPAPAAAAVAAPAPPSMPAGDFAGILARTADNAVAASLPLPAIEPAPAPVSAPVQVQVPVTDPRLGDELRTMRHLLERQLAQLAWNDLTRRAPETAELLKEMTSMGVAAELTTELLAQLPDGIGLDDAQRRVLAMLTRRIATTGDALLENGGRVAFVGPTGVGKATGIAKLAARWVMRRGARDLALVALAGQRFGAPEQLRGLTRRRGAE